MITFKIVVYVLKSQVWVLPISRCREKAHDGDAGRIVGSQDTA